MFRCAPIIRALFAVTAAHLQGDSVDQFRRAMLEKQQRKRREKLGLPPEEEDDETPDVWVSDREAEKRRQMEEEFERQQKIQRSLDILQERKLKKQQLMQQKREHKAKRMAEYRLQKQQRLERKQVGHQRQKQFRESTRRFDQEVTQEEESAMGSVGDLDPRSDFDSSGVASVHEKRQFQAQLQRAWRKN